MGLNTNSSDVTLDRPPQWGFILSSRMFLYEGRPDGAIFHFMIDIIDRSPLRGWY
jgi:hypothetical protein